ncbi:MAG: alpha/beta fold hydrolase [Azospirillaceae bacterium]|nr:alpha/beta fold hydrolase [Azospirillaceae bacterium]
MTQQPPPPRPPPPGTLLPPRLGPRPLGLHLTTALSILLSSPAGLPWLRNGSLPWKRPQRAAAALRKMVVEVDPEAFRHAVDREMRRRIDGLLTGLHGYRHHPYRRNLVEPPPVWTEGSSRLLDHGTPSAAPGAAEIPVLLVPSLINRHYILDLSQERSLVRWLAGQGLRPYLLDWGWPGELERRFTLGDYIAGRLDRALAFLCQRHHGPIAVAGYCMGGMLAVALTQLRPASVRSLTLLATPWDFHAGDRALALGLGIAASPFVPALEAWGEMPVDAIQTLFAGLDPLLVLRKFRRFADLAPGSAEAQAFVALEDWLNDGIPLVAAVARECLIGWYGRNEAALGKWVVAGCCVDPAAIRVPTLALIPGHDRIVAPASARALANRVPGARILTPALGHIGMIVGRGAVDQVWRPFAQWLHDAAQPGVRD